MQMPCADRHAHRDDIAACRRLLRGGSRTFFAASLLLPRGVREPASALYAFCRLADDAVDQHGARVDAVQRLRERLDRAYEGRPLPRPADRALAEVVARFTIPRELPGALLEGLEWDAGGRRYETIEDVYAYGTRVAGAVGAMMTLVMGARSPHAVARACDLGVAMQLSNIARDVGEDARSGRLYLPRTWLREAGLDPDAFLAAPQYTPALGTVVRRLLDCAEVLYRRAGPGIALLPPACRPGIHAAARLYCAIGRQVAANGLDSVSRRAVVPGWRKATLLARAAACAAALPSDATQPALAQTRYLVDAVVAHTPRAPVPRLRGHARGVTSRIDARASWVIDLFERLERREHLGRGG